MYTNANARSTFVIFSIEKEIHETPSGGQKPSGRENHDYYQKIQVLKDKFEKCRDQVNKVHGIELTKEDQLKKMEGLSKQLVMKRELLQRYKNSCPIDAIPKLM